MAGQVTWSIERARERLTELRFDMEATFREQQIRTAAAAATDALEGHPLSISENGGPSGMEFIPLTVPVQLTGWPSIDEPLPLAGGRYIECQVFAPMTGGFESVLVIEEQIREQVNAALNRDGKRVTFIEFDEAE